ncbi:H-2 class II histocompatibility antigen, E-S beta chain-like [Bufo gargarizans]|uniref:H-2 class II histocompatibility antigen, E-S beta chain-like n=1 Tax=Bufo gargarizans TaxID=30331 RepID=UPI001CF18953|nr:H-2 class II histocompatibility antigen, E-S beta chain-like [Bufo gargarizans]
MGMLYCISFIFFILLIRLDFCRLSAAVDYMTEIKSDCHFLNGTQQVRFLHRYFYNQEEFVYFDSEEGRYIAKTELGKPSAEAWNKDKDFIEREKSYVETFCKYNYGIATAVGVTDRRVQPEIVVSLIPRHEEPSTVHHLLQCNVFGFYPSEVEVKWYRNNQEETELVTSSVVFKNGDWTFQILVMLETEIQSSDTFTCEVHHSSLEAPHRVDWHPEISDSDRSKMATGIGGFVLGAVFLIAGIVMYLRGRKVQTSFRGPQSENFIHT